MTTFLYILFYGWVGGLVLISLLFLAVIKLVGGREKFTVLYNSVEGKNYAVHHIDWAVVIAVVFWPSTIVTTIFNYITARAAQPVDNQSHP